MSIASGLDAMREGFAKQFEAKGKGFVFRKAVRGAPVPIGSEERDLYIAGYNRDIRVSYYGFIAAVGAVMVSVIGLSMPGDGDADFPLVPFLVGLVLAFAVFMVSSAWAYYAPARALAQRMPVGKARTRAEMWSKNLQKTTYGHLGVLAASGAVFLLRLKLDEPLGSGFNLFIICAVAFVEAIAASMAFFKWRLDCSKKKKGSGESDGWT